MNKLSDEQLNHISGGDTALFDIYIDEMRQKYHVDSESLLFSVYMTPEEKETATHLLAHN